jgi:hypothetical protein
MIFSFLDAFRLSMNSGFSSGSRGFLLIGVPMTIELSFTISDGKASDLPLTHTLLCRFLMFKIGYDLVCHVN